MSNTYLIDKDWLGEGWKELIIHTVETNDIEWMMTGRIFKQIISGVKVDEDGSSRPATESEIDEVMERIARMVT